MFNKIAAISILMLAMIYFCGCECCDGNCGDDDGQASADCWRQYTNLCQSVPGVDCGCPYDHGSEAFVKKNTGWYYTNEPAVQLDLDPEGGRFPVEFTGTVLAGATYFDCPLDEFVPYIKKIEWSIADEPYSEEKSKVFDAPVIDPFQFNQCEYDSRITFKFYEECTEPGQFPVRVRVTDDVGNQKVNTNYVECLDNSPPHFSITCINCQGAAPLKATLRISPSKYTFFDKDDERLKYEIDWTNDGTVDKKVSFIDKGGAILENHTYTCVGKVAAVVTMTDPYGARTTEAVFVNPSGKVYSEKFVFPPDGTPHAVEPYTYADGDNYIFLAENNSGIRVFDGNDDPANPLDVVKIYDEWMSTVNDMATGHYGKDDYLFTVGYGQVVSYLITNPLDPTRLMNYTYYGCGASPNDPRNGDRIKIVADRVEVPPDRDIDYRYAFITSKDDQMVYGLYNIGSYFESHFIFRTSSFGSAGCGSVPTGIAYYNRYTKGDVCDNYFRTNQNGCCRRCGLLSLGTCGMVVINLTEPKTIGHPEWSLTPPPIGVTCKNGIQIPTIWPATKALTFRPENIDGVRVNQTNFVDVDVIGDYAFVLNSQDPSGHVANATNRILAYRISDVWDYGNNPSTDPVAIATLPSVGVLDRLEHETTSDGKIIVYGKYGTSGSGFAQVDVTGLVLNDDPTSVRLIRDYRKAEFPYDISISDDNVYLAELSGLRTFNENRDPKARYLRTIGQNMSLSYHLNRLYLSKEKAGVDAFNLVDLAPPDQKLDPVKPVKIAHIPTKGAALASEALDFRNDNDETVVLLAVNNAKVDLVTDEYHEANLELIDITKVKQAISFYSKVGEVHCLKTYKNKVLACTDNGVEIFEIGHDGTTMKVKSKVTITTNLATYDQVEIDNGLIAILSIGKQILLYTFDETESPINPVEAGSLTDLAARKIALDGESIYFYNSGIIGVIDISDSSNPLFLASHNYHNDYPENTIVDFWAEEGVIMVALEYAGIVVYQNCDREKFVLAGSANTVGMSTDRITPFAFPGRNFFWAPFMDLESGVWNIYRITDSVRCNVCSE